MILYLDASAFVPLLIEEPASLLCRKLWTDASHIVSVPLLYVEAAAALHQSNRMDRLDSNQLHFTRKNLDDLWSAVGQIEMSPTLLTSAAKLAGKHALRGYDSLHCAGGLLLNGAENAVAASGDQRLLDAWHAEGAYTLSTSNH